MDVASRIFLNITSDQYSDAEKGGAIMQVCQMPSHNGISKKAMLRVIWYLLKMSFELPEGAKGPEGI